MAQKYWLKNKTICFHMCEQNIECYLAFYEGFTRMCYLFVSANAPKLGSIMEKVVRAEWNSPSEVRIRNCVERILDNH